MQRTPKFSPKTRAILAAIMRKPLTVAEICASTGLPPKEVHPRIQNAVRSGALFGLAVEEPPPVDVFYEGEGPITFGDYSVRVLHTPGHCPGGVCLSVSKIGRAHV